MKRAIERVVALCGAVAVMFVAVQARAQPAPTPPPPPVGEIDLGDFHIGDTIVSEFVSITNGQNVWFRFRLLDGVTPKSWLNLDTSGSTITGGAAMNTELGLYDSYSYMLLNDDISGGGQSLTSSLAAAISCGGGSGERLGDDLGNWVGGRIDVGWNEKGAVWQSTLRPGVYHVCIVGFDADFSQSPNPNWIVSSSFQGTGSVRLRLKSGHVPATTWSEKHNGEDAGDSLETAQVVEGHGPLSRILATFGPGGTDMFKIRICDPANFSVVATSTLQWGNAYSSRLQLFDAEGRGVLSINGTTGATTTLSPPAGTNLVAGDYYLAVLSNCAGMSGFSAGAYAADGNVIWNFANAPSWNVSIPPNGTGASHPLGFFGRQSDCINNSYAYFVRLGLTGACHVAPAGCPADLDNGTGQGTPDGGVTIDDLLFFLTQFEEGC